MILLDIRIDLDGGDLQFPATVDQPKRFLKEYGRKKNALGRVFGNSFCLFQKIIGLM